MKPLGKSALFLDRDGVINVNHGYVHKIEHFDFLPGIFELVKFACQNNILVFVVTNQAGIGRGYYSEEEFLCLSSWMCEQFGKNGGAIEKVYFSPYHPMFGIGKYKKNDASRKPSPGMIIAAQEEYNINLSKSILVGDSVTDVQAGLAAGVGKNILLSDQISKEYFSLSSLFEVKNYMQKSLDLS